jgi:hypothetical protein
MKRAATIIAESIGFDVAEMAEYRYQRYTAPAVYAIGEKYFAAWPSKPKHQVGGAWVEYADQFGVRGTTTQVVWVCNASLS